jgi:hypothetical protein
MFDQLDQHWTLTAHRTPVQWDGMHDQVLVYDRRRPT